MKIIASDEKYGLCCYIQVKDLLYLADVIKSSSKCAAFKSIAVGCSNDFVKVIDKNLLTIIINNEYIINLVDYMNMSIVGLSTEIMQRLALFYDAFEKKGYRNAMADLKDILAFKRGVLSYKIPVVPTDRIVFLSGHFIFSSTQFKGIYMFRDVREFNVLEEDYQDYLRECILNVFDLDYAGYLNEELNYDIISEKNNILVKIIPKKKKSRLKQFMTKKKKHS